jgi:hypothetical protein
MNGWVYWLYFFSFGVLIGLLLTTLLEKPLNPSDCGQYLAFKRGGWIPVFYKQDNFNAFIHINPYFYNISVYNFSENFSSG